jgi:hypothetical protein
MSFQQQAIMVDPARPFTLYEVCPHCKGSGASSPPGGMFPPQGACPRCGGKEGRTQLFKTREDLLAYVAKLPDWAG